TSRQPVQAHQADRARRSRSQFAERPGQQCGGSLGAARDAAGAPAGLVAGRPCVEAVAVAEHAYIPATGGNSSTEDTGRRRGMSAPVSAPLPSEVCAE